MAVGWDDEFAGIGSEPGAGRGGGGSLFAWGGAGDGKDDYDEFDEDASGGVEVGADASDGNSSPAAAPAAASPARHDRSASTVEAVSPAQPVDASGIRPAGQRHRSRLGQGPMAGWAPAGGLLAEPKQPSPTKPHPEREPASRGRFPPTSSPYHDLTGAGLTLGADESMEALGEALGGTEATASATRSGAAAEPLPHHGAFGGRAGRQGHPPLPDGSLGQALARRALLQQQQQQQQQQRQQRRRASRQQRQRHPSLWRGVAVGARRVVFRPRPCRWRPS
mmetsp:Transcript_2971/g.12158  ORF Transcript_2971/g.12158 Transcript_2971/m.12158 type:complete len:279 (-) Transcript_2971:314-1150(-)